jgi:hypothetical protein
MSEVIGVVARVTDKVLPSGTYWSFVLDGDPQWYRTGRDKPKFEAGYKVKFNATEDKYGTHCDLKTVEFREGEAPPAAAPAKAAGGKSDYQLRTAYWDAKELRDIENQKRISYQAATNTAIALVNAALASEAIVLPASKAKGKRFEVLTEIVTTEADRIYAVYAAAPDNHAALVAGTKTAHVTDAEEVEEADEESQDFSHTTQANDEW